jgi:hypothetical protein
MAAQIHAGGKNSTEHQPSAFRFKVPCQGSSARVQVPAARACTAGPQRRGTFLAVSDANEPSAFRANNLPAAGWVQALQNAAEAGRACALATVASTRGSVPRQSGTKMLVFADGPAAGTVGGGKFESLVIDDAREVLRTGKILLKTYLLHEGSAESFGAVCGGEVTVLIEPQRPPAALFVFGAGHCA